MRLGKNTNRLTIGLQITNLHEEYPKLLWQGVEDMAAELDVNIVIYRGESLNSPSSQGYQCNVLYDLIHKNYLDGLILVTGTLCNFIPWKDFLDYIDRFRSVPIISITVEIPGCPSVLVDNTKGIHEAVSHLVECHQRKKIAFIRGPGTNEEAENRYQSYVSSISQYNLALDPRLVVFGNFSEGSGSLAVKELLDVKKADFDAIIACNDNMAIGALNELKKRGIDVPDQVAIIGFDNIPDCDNVIPALTTIKQPIYQQGRKALELLVNKLNGKKVPQRVVLPTFLLERSSCGCIGRPVEAVQGIIKKTDKESMKDWLQKEIAAVLDFTDNIGSKKGIDSGFIQDFISYLDQENPSFECGDVMLKKFSRLVSAQIQNEINISFWKDILDKLYYYNRLTNKGEKANNELLLRKMQDYTQEAILRAGVSERIRKDRMEWSARIAMQDMISSQSKGELFRKILLQLPYTQLFHCFLFTYLRVFRHNRGDRWVPVDKVRLHLVYDENQGLKEIFEEGIETPAIEFIPEKYRDYYRRHTYVVEPLYYAEEQYGYMVYELDVRDTNVYELITMSISTTYRSILLIEHEEQAKRELRAVFEELEEERNKLKKRNLEIENDIIMARKIQAELIPTKSPKQYLAFHYKPMDLVGGDFIDFVEFRDKNWIGVFLSDVSGHGIPAAFITSMIKSTIQQTRLLQDNPAYLLQALNESLYNQTGGNFATAFYGIFKAESRKFIFANAGHLIPYYLTQESIHQLDEMNRSIPLGILNNDEMLETGLSYTNQTVQLDKGSKLVLYTDGLTETTAYDDLNLDFEECFLEDTFRKNFKQNAQVFADKIFEKLVEFHGNENFNDDVCLICMDIE